MTKPRVAINGFGRIGRNVFRANLISQKLDIIAVNDLNSNDKLAHLLKYDSNYGILPEEIKSDDQYIYVGQQKIHGLSERDPEKLPWKDLQIDLVIESTGFFCDKESASKHLKAGAKKVIISAPGKNVDHTLVMGVNEEKYNPETDHVISNASCTTNCLAPVVKVLNDKFGIKDGMMTTIHAYTADQQLVDSPHKDPRRARAAALSMIPTSTGAAKAIGEVIPEVNGKLKGLAVRVPTPVVSLVDLVCNVEKETTPEEINQALKEAGSGPMKGILEVNEVPLVSIDFKGNPHSSIVEADQTMVIDGKLIKILAWYDNEWGYSNRMVDLCEYIAKKM